MKKLKFPLFLAVLAPSLHAAVVTWDGGGANNQWSTPENWSDDTIPTAGNDYVVDGVLFRSPDANSNTFDGDSLTVQNGGVLNLYRTNGGGYFTVTHNIPSLTVSNSEIRPQSSVGSIGHILSQSVALAGAVTLNMNENSSYTMRMFFNGGITGSGSLTFTRDATGSERKVVFAGDAGAYAGDISFSGLSGELFDFDVNNSGGWGQGALTVGNYTNLNLNTDFSSGSATIELSTTSATLNLNAVVTVAGLTIGGNAVEEGVYDASQLAALGYGGTFGGTGSLTVIPEPGAAFLGCVGSCLLLLRRRSG